MKAGGCPSELNHEEHNCPCSYRHVRRHFCAAAEGTGGEGIGSTNEPGCGRRLLTRRLRVLKKASRQENLWNLRAIRLQ